MEIYAVVVADVMASSTRKDVRTLLGKKLAAVSEKQLRQKLIRLPYSVTAGDEFQTITGELSSLPALLLDLRAALQPLPLRVGVGIGDVANRVLDAEAEFSFVRARLLRDGFWPRRRR